MVRLEVRKLASIATDATASVATDAAALVHKLRDGLSVHATGGVSHHVTSWVVRHHLLSPNFLIMLILLCVVVVLLWCCTGCGRRRGHFGSLSWREECFVYGWLMKWLLGENDTFTINMIVHEVRGGALGAKVENKGDKSNKHMVVCVSAGDEKYYTAPSKKACWQEEISLRVPQGVKNIQVTISEASARKPAHKDLVGRVNVASLIRRLDSFSKQEQQDEEKGGAAPKLYEELVVMRNSKGVNACSLLLSMSRRPFLDKRTPLLKNVDTSKVSGPLAQRLVQAQAETMQRKKKRSPQGPGEPGSGQEAGLSGASAGEESHAGGRETLDSKDIAHSELQVLAGTLDGPVQKAGSWGFLEELYMRVYARESQSGTSSGDTKRRWFLGLWPLADMQKIRAGQGSEQTIPPQKEIPVLRITRVTADRAKNTYFTISFRRDDNTRKDMYLKRVDRDRDTWVEALQLFLVALRRQMSQSRGGRQAVEETHSEEAVTLSTAGSVRSSTSGLVKALSALRPVGSHEPEVAGDAADSSRSASWRLNQGMLLPSQRAPANSREPAAKGSTRRGAFPKTAAKEGATLKVNRQGSRPLRGPSDSGGASSGLDEFTSDQDEEEEDEE